MMEKAITKIEIFTENPQRRLSKAPSINKRNKEDIV